MHKRASVVSVAMIALSLAFAGCDSSSSGSGSTSTTSPAIVHNACWSAVDDLSNDISAAANASDIPASTVLASFRACGEAASWRKYAEIDKISDEVGGLGDTNGPFNPSTALDLLCARFDARRTSVTCKLR